MKNDVEIEVTVRVNGEEVWRDVAITHDEKNVPYIVGTIAEKYQKEAAEKNAA